MNLLFPSLVPELCANRRQRPGHSARARDQLRRIRGGCEVEELLRLLRKGRVRLGDQDKGPLNDIAAVLHRILCGCYAAYCDGPHGVLDGGEGGVADGIRVLGHGGNHIAGGGQLLAVLAVVCCAGDGFKAVPGSAAGFPANQDNLRILSADVLPVGDLAGVDSGDGIYIKFGYRIVGIHDHRDTVIGQHRPGQPLGGFLHFQIAAAEADVAAPFQNRLDARAGAGGVVGEGHTVVLRLKRLTQRTDHLLHRGRAISGDGAGRFL